MKTVHLSHIDNNMGFKAASVLAGVLADKDTDIIDPVVIAWRDKRMSRMSPVLADCPIDTSWREYGVSHGGKLEVEVNAEYDSIFADSSAFESYGPSPYVNLKDMQGNEYLCPINALRDLRSAKMPNNEMCSALDEWTSKMT